MVIRLDREEFAPPIDFTVISICASMREYRLAHLMNLALRWELVRDEDVNYGADPAVMPIYARFVFDDPLSHRCYCLLGNRPLVRPEVIRAGDLFGTEETTLLLPELAKADYVLRVPDDLGSDELDRLCDLIRGISGVTIAYLADPRKMKNVEPLFD